MIPYEELLSVLRENGEEAYRTFHKSLLKDENIELIGVRTPVLRKLARTYQAELETLMTFPDEFYEVTFLKCACASRLPFERFVAYVGRLVPLLNNWAVCDSFLAPCIRAHREEFLPYLERFFGGGEFEKRFALVTLLHDYVEEPWLTLVCSYLERCSDEPYYVTTAAAWLLAEVLVKDFGRGIEFLREGNLDSRIRAKGIQKARESFRLTRGQKAALSAQES